MIFRAFKLAIFMERYTKAAVFEIREISIYWVCMQARTEKEDLKITERKNR